MLLNPSTADAFKSDPTCTRCVRFARREGCSALTIVNLFSYRATDPGELIGHPDPVGPRNNEFIFHHCRPGHLVVAAWGADAAAVERGREVGRCLAVAGVSLSCLGTTAAGHPRHPLYVRSSAPLVPYSAADPE